MITHQHAYVVATGQFLRGGFYDPRPATGEGLAVFSEGQPFPDYRTQRWDVGAGAVRAATQPEIDAYDGDRLAALADVGARQKDLLALCATVLEKFDPAWTAMTPAQKRTAVLTLADRWKFWRQYAEANL